MIKRGNLLACARAEAVSMFVAPGPIEDVATIICCLNFDLE